MRRLTSGLVLVLALLAPTARADQSLPREVTLPWTPVRALLRDYCGPAALTNVLRYWGHPADQATVGRAVFDRERRATPAGDLILYAREAGFAAASRSGSRDQLRRWLAAGFPVIILQDLSAGDRRGHYRVVVGYSDTKQQFLVCDCTETSLCSFGYEQFDDLWFHFDNWCLIVAPVEKSAGMALEDATSPVLHLDLAEAYLRRKERDAAARELNEIMRRFPRHRAARKLLAKLSSLR